MKGLLAEIQWATPVDINDTALYHLFRLLTLHLPAVSPPPILWLASCRFLHLRCLIFPSTCVSRSSSSTPSPPILAVHCHQTLPCFLKPQTFSPTIMSHLLNLNIHHLAASELGNLVPLAEICGRKSAQRITHRTAIGRTSYSGEVSVMMRSAVPIMRSLRSNTGANAVITANSTIALITAGR